MLIYLYRFIVSATFCNPKGTKELAEKLELLCEVLRIHNQKTQLFPIKNGVDFLGFHFYLTDTGKIYKKLRQSNKKRMKRKMKAYKRKYEEGIFDYNDIRQRLASWRGHVLHGDTYELRKKILESTWFGKSV